MVYVVLLQWGWVVRDTCWSVGMGSCFLQACQKDRTIETITAKILHCKAAALFPIFTLD